MPVSCLITARNMKCGPTVFSTCLVVVAFIVNVLKIFTEVGAVGSKYRVLKSECSAQWSFYIFLTFTYSFLSGGSPYLSLDSNTGAIKLTSNINGITEDTTLDLTAVAQDHGEPRLKATGESSSSSRDAL